MQLRKELRKRIKERLIGKTSAGEKINVNPLHFDEQFPFIEISTPFDESELISNSIRATGHTLTVQIEAVVQADKNEIYDHLDDLAEEIECLIELDETFGRLTGSLVLSRTESEAVHEAERSVGFIRLTYEANYVKQKTPKADPNLPKFKGTQIGGMDA